MVRALAVMLLAACSGGGEILPDAPPAPDAMGASCFDTTLVIERDGDQLSLSAAIDPPHAITWSASAGALSATTGDTVTWTAPPPPDHGRIIVTLGARVTKEGCAPLELTRQEVIDWPVERRIVVLYRNDVVGSEAVARAYQELRDLDEEQLCQVLPGAPDSIIGTDDLMTLVDQAMECVEAVGPHVEILVPVYGVPFFVGDLDLSVDSLLALGSAGKSQDIPAPNPYAQPAQSGAGIYPAVMTFTDFRAGHAEELFLVTRIDAGDSDLAIDLALRDLQTPEPCADNGTLYVDGSMGLPHPEHEAAGTPEALEWDLAAVALHFGPSVVEDWQAAALDVCENAITYAGGRGASPPDCTWAPTAIALSLDDCFSCDVRNEFEWVPRQIRNGVAAALATVTETTPAELPHVDEVVRRAHDTPWLGFAQIAWSSTPLVPSAVVWLGDPLATIYEPPECERAR